MKTIDDKSLEAIDEWFKARCDGLWEHQSGLKFETTDNPGWLITIDEAIDESVFNDISIEVRKRWGAECVREQDTPKKYAASLNPSPTQIIKLKKAKIKIYAVSLKNCVCAVAHVLTRLKRKRVSS